MTTLVHGERATAQVVAASGALFGRGELRELDSSTLDAALAEVPTAQVRLADGPTVVDLLVATGLADSRGAARRAVAEGGAYVNNAKVTDEAWQPSSGDLLAGSWLVVRARQADPRRSPGRTRLTCEKGGGGDHRHPLRKTARGGLYSSPCRRGERLRASSERDDHPMTPHLRCRSHRSGPGRYCTDALDHVQ
jgi:hypothetical protein